MGYIVVQVPAHEVRIPAEQVLEMVDQADLLEAIMSRQDLIDELMQALPDIDIEAAYILRHKGERIERPRPMQDNGW